MMTSKPSQDSQLSYVVRRSPIHGRGLFARVSIPTDHQIGLYEGRVTQRDGEHVLWVEDDEGRAFGIEGQNDLRFVNHSKSPNAVFLGDELHSLRPIEEGEEITFDYGEDWA